MCRQEHFGIRGIRIRVSRNQLISIRDLTYIWCGVLKTQKRNYGWSSMPQHHGFHGENGWNIFLALNIKVIVWENFRGLIFTGEMSRGLSGWMSGFPCRLPVSMYRSCFWVTLVNTQTHSEHAAEEMQDKQKHASTKITARKLVHQRMR